MSRFKTYYTPVVDLMYPRLSVTEKWDNAQRKFETCDINDQGAFWACSFVLSDAERSNVGSRHGALRCYDTRAKATAHGTRQNYLQIRGAV